MFYVGISQKINLQKFSVKEGLIQSTVKRIEPDGYGNLWLATNNGLSKFNGKRFDNFTTTNGLPSNEITDLLFTNDLLFIGTKKGLCLYNGNKIINTGIFKKISGSIAKIIERKGLLHIISHKGYYTIDISKSNYKLDSIAIPNVVSQRPSDAEFDEDGNLWVSTLKKGIFFIELNISTKIPKFVLIQNSASSAVVNNKLIRIANFNSTNLLRGESIYGIEFDKKQNLLLSDWGNGIAQINFEKINQTGFVANYLKFDSTTTTSPISIDRFVNIQKDTEGNLFFATDGFGFFKVLIDKNTNDYEYTKNSTQWISSEQGFFGNNPMSFYQDQNQNYWIGTLYDGLVLMNNKSSLSYNKVSGLVEEKVISVFKASDNAIWSGTYGGGAFRFKDGKFSRCFWENGISESIIKGITEDKFGNIWLGTVGGGISIIQKENTNKQLQVTKTISQINGLSNNYVSFLYSDKDGVIWAGYQGANHIDKIIIKPDLTFSITPYPISNLGSYNVCCILQDKEKNIWITTNDGVYILNTNSGYVNHEYSVFKNVQTIAEDWNGNMWLGTSDIGLVILKNKLKARYFENGKLNNVEKVNTETGINSNCINTILFEKESAWIISNNGINEIKIDTYLNLIKEIKTYNKGKGFASYDNKPNTAVFDNNNVIWIGSVEGLTEYKNLNHTTNAVQKDIVIHINAINIEGKPINWADTTLFSGSGEYSTLKFDGYFNWYKIPKDLQLDYNHNSIQFYLNTNHIADQNQVNYNYKLVGYDKDWSTIYNNNEISYRNLPAGDYSLIIKASTTSDFSSSDEFTYHFSVKPPFWKTTSFYVVVFIVLFILGYYFITNREKRLKREKLKLELEVKSRTSEIEKKKKEIEMQNSLIQGINKDLTDSIKYAERIQKTILPSTTLLNNYFKDYCVYYKPRNIVSGDYYWIKELNGLVYVAVVDCTGHGVPGAFMSLITSNILNEAISFNICQESPAKILEYLRKEINVRISQSVTDKINDGLDISLICFNKEKNTVEYVNANRPLYIISNNELITLASENVNIGGFADLDSVIPTKTISVKPNDLLFMFTDGITDQFGGDKNKKYNPARLRQFLLMNDHLSLTELEYKLNEEISQWQGSYEQTDDILFIGLRV